jgi:nucleotide-binding universal stress UspA family protein
MPRTILVPLDGSELSEKAIPYALALIRASGGQIIFMRAVLTASSPAPGAITFNAALREAAGDYLNRHVEATTKAGLSAEAIVVEDEAGYAILATAQQRQPDLIVMSTHGRSGLGRVVWGSVADRVLHEAAAPIFLIPRAVDVDWARTEPAHLVVPLDGSPLAEAALGPAEKLAADLKAEVVLVQAIPPETWLMTGMDAWASPELYASELHDEQVAAANKYLESKAADLNSKGIATTIVVAEWTHPTTAIRHAVERHHAHAVVVATHGRGGATRLLLGSVTDAVLRSARVPVLVVRPAAATPVPESQSMVKVDERDLLIMMSPAEVEFTRVALQHFLNSSPGRDIVRAFDLLERLYQIEAGAKPGQADVSSRTGAKAAPSR